MHNYDDEINDLLDRVETLEEGGGGGGGATSAANVTYDDYPTDYGANNVQGVLEKIKDLLASKISRVVNGNFLVFGEEGINLQLSGGRNGITRKVNLTENGLRPSTNGDIPLGAKAARWNGVYATSGDFAGDVTVSGTIDGVTTGNALPILVEAVTKTNVAIQPNTISNANTNVAKEGYIPIGIVGINITGTGATNAVIQKFFLNGTTAGINIFNRGTTATNMSVVTYVLYQLDNGTPVVVSEPLMEIENEVKV